MFIDDFRLCALYTPCSTSVMRTIHPLAYFRSCAVHSIFLNSSFFIDIQRCIYRSCFPCTFFGILRSGAVVCQCIQTYIFLHFLGILRSNSYGWVLLEHSDFSWVSLRLELNTERRGQDRRGIQRLLISFLYWNKKIENHISMMSLVTSMVMTSAMMKMTP